MRGVFPHFVRYSKHNKKSAGVPHFFENRERARLGTYASTRPRSPDHDMVLSQLESCVVVIPDRWATLVVACVK